MKYLECCLKESLRLYPSVPNIKRHISEDIVLGGYKIPAGSVISLHIYSLHRNEDVFPEPLAFKPERFEREQTCGRHPFAFVPFSGGPRNCIGKVYYIIPIFLIMNRIIFKTFIIGQRFALFEEKVVLSTLLRRFRFSYNTNKHGPAKPAADLVLKPHHAMPLEVTPLVNRF